MLFDTMEDVAVDTVGAAYKTASFPCWFAGLNNQTFPYSLAFLSFQESHSNHPLASKQPWLPPFTMTEYKVADDREFEINNPVVHQTTPPSKPPNAFVKAMRHVYHPLGFKKGYNFPLCKEICPVPLAVGKT